MYVRKIYGMELFFITYVRKIYIIERMKECFLQIESHAKRRINLSNRLKSTGSLESSPSFWKQALQKKCQNPGRIGLHKRLMEI